MGCCDVKKQRLALLVFASFWGVSGGLSAASGDAVRFIHFNDVYALTNLPRLASLIENERRENTFVTLGGDFLSPSLLSAVDKGQSMAEVLSSLPVDFACLGNHEADVGLEAMWAALDVLDATVLNSNIGLAPREETGLALPTSCVVDTGKRRVGLVGLCDPSPALYSRDAFGVGAVERSISVESALQREARRLVSEEGCDAVVAITHQDADLDLALSRVIGESYSELRVPLILGGHDHESFDLECRGVRTLKAGINAEAAWVVDLTFGDGERPTVEARLVETFGLKPLPRVENIVNRHSARVDKLDRTVLKEIEATHRLGRALSSKRVRYEQCSVGCLVCTAVRKALRCDLALLNSGAIRGNRHYDTENSFTFANLVQELPYDTEMVVVTMPGRVLQETLRHSLLHRVGSGGFLQHGNHLQMRKTKTTPVLLEILTIGGHAFDLSAHYKVALPCRLLEGMDRLAPLLDWVSEREQQHTTNSLYVPKKTQSFPPEDDRPAKDLCLEVYHREMWLSLGASFEEISPFRGHVTAAGLRAALIRKFDVEPSEELVKDVLAVFDLDDDGVVQRLEYDACVEAMRLGHYTAEAANTIMRLRLRRRTRLQL